MPIEWGRFLGTSRDDRICELCFHNKIGDEYHYLLECSYFSDARRVYLPRNLLAIPNTDCKIVLKKFQVIFRNI